MNQNEINTDKCNNNDRIKASLFGFFIGDALGVPVEAICNCFPKECILKISEMKEDEINKHPKGTWSADSSMTLAIIDGMLNSKFPNIDEKKIAQNFLEFVQNGKFTPFGYAIYRDSHTENFLYGYQRNAYYNMGKSSIYCMDSGSLAMILPVALYLFSADIDYSNSDFFDEISAILGITSSNMSSILGYYIYSAYLCELLKNHDKFEAYHNLQNTLKRECIENHKLSGIKNLYSRIINEDISKLDEKNINSSLNTVDTLEATMWSILTTNSFEEAVLRAVNIGVNANTVGALTGALAGIIYGFDSIPEKWVNALQKKEYIEEQINLFVEYLNKIEISDKKDIVIPKLDEEVKNSKQQYSENEAITKLVNRIDERLENLHYQDLDDGMENLINQIKCMKKNGGDPDDYEFLFMPFGDKYHIDIDKMMERIDKRIEELSRIESSGNQNISDSNIDTNDEKVKEEYEIQLEKKLEELNRIKSSGNQNISDSNIDIKDEKVMETPEIQNENNNAPIEKTLEEYIMEKFENTYYGSTINEYFQNAFLDKNVAKIFVNEISKDNDVLSEFIKFLMRGNYNYVQRVFKGYTIKKIHELNPKFSPSMVFWFLRKLKTNPKWANEAIIRDFFNKDYVLKLLEDCEVPFDSKDDTNDENVKKHKYSDLNMTLGKFIINKKLTKNDIERLKLGHMPEGKSEHLLWYVEDNKLYVHNRDTGYCAYIVELNTSGQLLVIVNRDYKPDSFKFKPDEEIILEILNDKNGETVLDSNEQKELAAMLLGLSLEDINQSSGMIDENLLYVSVPVRGGDSLIVDKKGEVLYASSAVDFDEHLNKYKNGGRTPIESFF